MAVNKDFMNYRARLIDKMEELYDDYDTWDEAAELDTDLKAIDVSENFGELCAVYMTWFGKDALKREHIPVALLWQAEANEREAKECLRRAEELRIEAHKYN